MSAQPQPTEEGLTVASSLTGAALQALLRNRNFVPLWIGQMVSYLGDQFTLIAALSIVSRLAGSNSGLAMAGLGLANAVPSIALGLFGGVLVDRLDHKKVMIVSDALRGLAIFLVLFVNDDPSRLWLFAVALAITGASSTLFYPARAAVLPSIVPRRMLAGANALLEAGFVIALVFGALLAGILIQRFGATVALTFDGLSYLFSAAMIMLLRVPKQRSERRTISVRQVWIELREGLDYLWNTRSMRYIMGMSIMVSGSIGAVLLLSLEYLTKELHVGAGQYGLVIAVLGLGIVMGGVLIQRLSQYLPTNRLVAAAIALNGLAMLGFVFRPTFSVVCFFTTLIGLSMVVARTVFGTLTQAIPPDELRGRVQSAFNLMTSVPLAVAVGMVGLLLQLVTQEVSFLPIGLTALPNGIRYHHVVSHHGIIFGAFAAAMLLTAWLTTNVLKGIDDAVFSAASRA